MRINHNISSMVGQGALFKANRATAKSLERLSTGLRINTAADDAAGLGVSENLRTQVRGLNMALRNTQDAIALLNIADGALQEQADILQRMRELVIQARNDTYTATERGYMYQEFSHLMDELDRIAAATNYNGLQLFATPEISGLDVSGGLSRRTYAASWPGGFTTTNGLETNHATAQARSIWTDPTLSVFGTSDYTSGHHFNMMVGANYTSQDAAAFSATYQSFTAGSGAANMVTVQLGQMDANAILTPYPSGFTVANLGNGQSANMGDARAMWDSFAWRGDPNLAYGAQYDNEDTLMDNYGLRDGANAVDMGFQGKMQFLLDMIDGNANRVNDRLINNLFSGRRDVTGLDRINKMRASIGALINRFEHSVNNALNSIANQQDAESVIRDSDFAREATTLSRNQILTQSATAMLAQSNMVPRSVLQLIG